MVGKNSTNTKQNHWPLAGWICISFFLCSFVAFFPGDVQSDTFSMWKMAITGEYHDWHPPLISYLMRLGSHINNDFSPVLFLQLGLLWTGHYLYALALRHYFKNWALLFCFLGIAPFILALSGLIQKTPLTAGCFQFCSGLLLLHYVRNSKPKLLLCIVFLIVLLIGTVIRELSYPASFIIAMLGLYVYFRPKNISLKVFASGASIAAILMAVFMFSNTFFMYSILSTKKGNKIKALFEYDLAGIYFITNKVYAKKYFNLRNYTHKRMDKLYEHYLGLYQIRLIYVGVKSSDISYLRNEWFKAITENPTAYLAHRFNALKKSLGFTNTVQTFFGECYRPKLDSQKKFGTVLTKSDNVLFKILKSYLIPLKNAFYMKPWFWVLLNTTLSFFAVWMLSLTTKYAAILPLCAIMWSGTSMLVFYLLVCYSADSRFIYWTMVSTTYAGTGLLGIKLLEWKS